MQFPDIVEFCEEMANAGKTVIVAALDGTFQRKVCSYFKFILGWFVVCMFLSLSLFLYNKFNYLNTMHTYSHSVQSLI